MQNTEFLERDPRCILKEAIPAGFLQAWVLDCTVYVCWHIDFVLLNAKDKFLQKEKNKGQ